MDTFSLVVDVVLAICAAYIVFRVRDRVVKWSALMVVGVFLQFPAPAQAGAFGYLASALIIGGGVGLGLATGRLNAATKDKVGLGLLSIILLAGLVAAIAPAFPQPARSFATWVAAAVIVLSASMWVWRRVGHRPTAQ